jgi:FixJ family two-component response regulator
MIKRNRTVTEEKNRIYLIDDDESVRKALKRLLGSYGFLASIFASAEEFLDVVPCDAKGCLVLDIHMPGMNGFQLQEELAALGSRLPIIFITADKDIAIKVHSLQAGVVGLLQKPFNDQALIDLIHEALGRHNQQK